MIIVAAFALVVLTVPLAGGRLSRLTELELAWTPVLVAALGAQVLMTTVLATAWPSGAMVTLHLLTYAAAVAFLVRNRYVPWLWLAGAGGISNLAAIAANGGVMPASTAALATADLPTATEGFVNSGAVTAPRLWFLGDVFALPASWPLANVYSVGDVLLVLGCGLLLHRVCASRLLPAGRPTGPVRAPTAHRMVPAGSSRGCEASTLP